MDKELITSAKAQIPPVDEIIKEAFRELKFDSSYVLNNFGCALLEVDKKATEIFNSYELKALTHLAELWIKKQEKSVRDKIEAFIGLDNPEEGIKKLAEVFVDFGRLVKEFEKDLGNMRKARGGKTFEKVIYEFLNLIGVSCEMPKGKEGNQLGKFDIVIPSVEVATEFPDQAVFLACKRTLRERWKQEVPQGGTNRRVYLLTLDDDLSAGKAKEVKEKGLIAYVKDEIKREKFQDKHWIRPLSELPKDLGTYRKL